MALKDFCKKYGLTIEQATGKEKYTVAEVIELTKGQYGSESLKEFFKK